MKYNPAEQLGMMWDFLKMGKQSCSECGLTFEDEPHEYKYCPNCGADMRGEQDE